MKVLRIVLLYVSCVMFNIVIVVVDRSVFYCCCSLVLCIVDQFYLGPVSCPQLKLVSNG